MVKYTLFLFQIPVYFGSMLVCMYYVMVCDRYVCIGIYRTLYTSVHLWLTVYILYA
jgi:hypothetical protein